MGLAEILCIIILAAVIILILQVAFKKNTVDIQQLKAELLADIKTYQGEIKNDLLNEIRASRTETISTIQSSMKMVGDTLNENQQKMGEMQDKRLADMNTSLNEKQDILQKAINSRLISVDERFKTFTEQNAVSLDGLRTTIQNRLQSIQDDNAKQLEKMRMTVDEKLQKTLDERITQSFKLVNDRLQEVYMGLGEMKSLANGVGDLKKVLSNVKTRGIMGEIQLGAILEEMLSKEQYEENVVTKPSSANRVEFAIRLPGDGDTPVYLPIDAKFPADTYNQLVDAYDSGDPAAISAAYNSLETRIKGCAKDIHDKYIDPPYTTDFAIMFLPFEGLYAEVVRRGLVDTLQRLYKVNIAGPTTFAALLNSLQMGFKTLAIQKRSSEVWNVLGAVKTEFSTFNDVLLAAQNRIEQTSRELDKLVGVRTRKINSKLREVTELPGADSVKLLETFDDIEE
ncbi:MAG: DNA recombination protein RmuC [Oscillospiraceae bacterium]